MPIIRNSDLSSSEENTSPGLESIGIVDAAREVTIASKSRVPRHIHTNTEAAMVLLEGELQALVGSQRETIAAGDVVLAPAGTVHGFINLSDSPARLLYVFPIHEPDRVLTTPPNAPPSGFPSEQGLSGFRSPHDRPLERENES